MADESDVDQPVPTIGAIQTDVGFGNLFRLELIKLILGLAPALLAFTVAFRPKLEHPQWLLLMWIGWGSLGIATLGGMINMYGWERFYISYRDYKRDLDAGKIARKRITAWRRIGARLQFSGFGLGVLAIALFAAINLDKVVTS
ncbi:hypothetical protein [Ralstonia solanacearum]|uniref:hypothetical protein n=1 Tax=Ralstonia solanacearum TaxID=305 RepID=UPI0018D11E34|nr:hypothetical protein [Ralstonia solanacearum]